MPSLADRWMHRLEVAPSAEEKQRLAEAQAAGLALYDFATRDIIQHRSGGGPAGQERDYTVTLSMSDAEKKRAYALIFHGEGSPEARAAQLGVEANRPGKPNIVNVDKALVDPRLNPNLDVGDPVLREQIRERALEDRTRMMAIFARDYGGLTPGSKIPPVDVLAGKLESAFGSDKAGGELAALLVREVHPSPKTAAKAMHYAVEGLGTNNELIDRTAGRMNRDEIATMREEYKDLPRNTDHEDLYEALGIFGHGFGDLSGDDRLRAERMMLGQPRNDRERAEVAAFTIQQQRDETGAVGRWLASGSIQEAMLNQQEAELNEQLGGQVTFGPEGKPQWSNTRAFDANNRFTGDSASFLASTQGAELAAQNYSAKIDQYANVAATTIAIIGAIAAAAVTVLTGGAASPLLLAAIAVLTGLTAMGAQTMIKGGAYGWEQAAMDLGMTAVQALTAGVGQSLALGVARWNGGIAGGNEGRS